LIGPRPTGGEEYELAPRSGGVSGDEADVRDSRAEAFGRTKHHRRARSVCRGV